MAISVTNIEKYISEGRVYTAVTVPAQNTMPTLTAGVPAGGTDVGATIGETTFRYKATIETVEIEQTALPVAAHVTKEEASIEVTVAEAVAAQIKNALQQTFNKSVTGGNILQVGGLTAVTGQSVAVVSQSVGVAGPKYNGAYLFKAYNDAGAEVSFKRGAVRVVKLTLRGYTDDTYLGRDQGNQLGFFFEES